MFRLFSIIVIKTFIISIDLILSPSEFDQLLVTDLDVSDSKFLLV